MISKTWWKIGGATALVALLVTAGVAMAHAGGRAGGAAASSALAYDGDPATGVLTNVNRNGTVLFERIEFTPADVAIHARGPGVGLRALNATTVTLTLPADATVVVHEEVPDWSPAGATITYANGEKLNVRVHNGTLALDGSVLTLALDENGGAQLAGAGPKGDCGKGGPGGRGHGGPGAAGMPGGFGGPGGRGPRGR